MKTSDSLELSLGDTGSAKLYLLDPHILLKPQSQAFVAENSERSPAGIPHRGQSPVPYTSVAEGTTHS